MNNVKDKLLASFVLCFGLSALGVTQTFQDLAAPQQLNSYNAGKGGGVGGGVLKSFTVATSGYFYTGGYHFYNSGGILSNQAYADNAAGHYTTASGFGGTIPFTSSTFGSNLGNYGNDTALEAVSGSDAGLRAVASYNVSPFTSSITVPNPNMYGEIYLGSGLTSGFNYGLIYNADVVCDMMIGDPNSSTVFMQTDGGNSPASTGFVAYGTNNWSVSVSQSVAKPATPDQYYHPMAVGTGTDGTEYLYYVDGSGHIYGIPAVLGGSSFTSMYTESSAAGDAGLCSTGVTSDHHLYLAWVSSGGIYADVFSIGNYGALTAVATNQLLVSTTGGLAGLSASSQGLFVDSFNHNSTYNLAIGWITPTGTVFNYGTAPGQQLDTSLISTDHIDGIKAFGGTTPVIFATSTSSGHNKFYAITTAGTSSAMTYTSYTDTVDTDNTTSTGIMDANVNGSGYAIGKAYLTLGPAHGTAYLKVTFIQYQ